MAPTRTVKSKFTKASTKSSPSKPSIMARGAQSAPRAGPKAASSSGSSSQVRSKSKPKPSRGPAPVKKKKRRVYTEKELGVPTLNAITPVGVQAPKGKKGKVFVDDRESMMTILAMVNADKEGQIESKMMKARQMEEIREARRAEAEARQADKKSKFEDTKDSMRKKRKRKTDEPDAAASSPRTAATKNLRSSKKRVSFA
ncbi:MAG: 60S ribosomal subunit assembly/export protein [Thelocarpon impressellum]|nr:MAG: 60S ribosomal subunit assembly/export protein [Thelocarpon impressellum]